MTELMCYFFFLKWYQNLIYYIGASQMAFFKNNCYSLLVTGDYNLLSENLMRNILGFYFFWFLVNIDFTIFGIFVLNWIEFSWVLAWLKTITNSIQNTILIFLLRLNWKKLQSMKVWQSNLVVIWLLVCVKRVLW